MYEHQRLKIPERKWERITMNFVVGIPQTKWKFNAVCVIVDRLTKSAHFILVAVTYSSERLAEIYIREIIRLHGVPVSIISDRDLGGSWDQFVLLVEFDYNKSYHSSIQMAPYKASYGRPCHSLFGWFEPGEAQLLGTDLVHDTLENVKMIQDQLRTVQYRKKSYANCRVCDVAFMILETILAAVSRLLGFGA
uniref:Uncharacterized protein LOC104216753 n=1 Tax=Nicotiana sylvestris TaxID=4096 RepID=A0A1U7VTC0_NICSY|nr:PREDICTED: uncharacterized protein LOC104216753 [Nicotiana sylvestris]